MSELRPPQIGCVPERVGSRRSHYATLAALLLGVWAPAHTVGASATAASSTPATVPPLLCYTFDDQSSSTQNDGTLGACAGAISGSGWQFVPNGAGQALSMSSSTCVDPTCSDSNFDIGDADFALRAKFRVLAASGSTERFLISKRRNGGGPLGDRGYALLFDPTSGHASFRLKGTDQVQVESTVRVDDQIQHDVLGVRAGAQIRLYVDGLLSGSVAVPAGFGSTSNDRALTFGKPAFGSGTGFAGELDLVALYDRAVTPTDVGGGPDCNQNGVDDTLEIAAGQAPDCDADGVLDTCQGGAVTNDCNLDGICDEQELSHGLVPDVDHDGSPDDCQSWQQLPFGFDSIVVFGDSLSDTGNAWAVSGHTNPESPPNWQGHFSNGRMWIEYLTGYLGVAPNRVRNYAFGGATSGTNNVSGPGVLPGMTQELQAFQADVATGQLVPTHRTLFVVWIGGNDFYDHQALLPTVPDAMANIESALRGLAQAGARHFLVPNLPDLGATPVAHSYDDPDKIVAARMGTIGFNANLKSLLGQLEPEIGADIIHYDVFDLFERMVADPASFGFTDVIGQCYDPNTGVVCVNPSQHIFWDRIHPTTNAHRFLALGADAALLGGGTPLSLPELTAQHADVRIASPVHGAFSIDPVLTVSGSVAQHGAEMTIGAQYGVSAEVKRLALDVNGVLAIPDATGAWSVVLPIDPAQVEVPIVATLRVGEVVIDRDRIVVFRGPSVGSDQMLEEAVVARLTRAGIAPLEDELMGYLIAHNKLNLHTILNASNPLSQDWGGFGHLINETNAGYNCASIEIVPKQDRVFVRVALHDVWINYDAKYWIQDLWGFSWPHFGGEEINCSGTMHASQISFWTELSLQPAPFFYNVDVSQVEDLEFNLFGFGNTGACAAAAGFANLIPTVDINVEQKVRDGITQRLANFNEQDGLATSLEKLLDRLKLSATLSEALGVHARGDISRIELSPQGIEVALRTRFWGATPPAQRTYAVPTSELPEFGLDPVSGEPYEFAVFIGLTALNQFLMAKPDFLPQGPPRTMIDVGSGPQAITAELVGALIPAFKRLYPLTPLEMRVQFTLPPMLMGQPSSAAALSDLYLGQVVLSLEPLGSDGSNPYLSLALDVRGDVVLGHDASNSSLALHLALAVDPQSATIVKNMLNVDETSLLLLLDGLAQGFVPGAGAQAASFPIPSFEGLHLGVESISSGSGYVTTVLDLESDYQKPDLIVESIDPIGAVDVNFPWEIHCVIKNIGSMSASGGPCFVGGALSPDSLFQNGNDIGLAQVPVQLGNGLSPGGSMNVTIPVPAMPNLPFSQQTLFVLVDVPGIPGGTGAFCERTETNNHRGEGIFLSAPDARVVSISVPLNVIGGVGPRPYRVHVSRNNLGNGVLHVPVRVVVGMGFGSTFADDSIDLLPGHEGYVDVLVPTPSSNGAAPQTNYFTVTACTNLLSDSNPNNNCQSTTVGIAVPYWDLRYDIVNAPSSVNRCGSTHWDVRVTNVGNVSSMNVCSITGIGRYPLAGQWSWCLGLFNFTTPNIAPGASWMYHVNNYFVNCGALLGTQYIKTEVNYSNGCFDNFTTGNYDNQAILVH